MFGYEELLAAFAEAYASAVFFHGDIHSQLLEMSSDAWLLDVDIYTGARGAPSLCVLAALLSDSGSSIVEGVPETALAVGSRRSPREELGQQPGGILAGHGCDAGPRGVGAEDARGFHAAGCPERGPAE